MVHATHSAASSWHRVSDVSGCKQPPQPHHAAPAAQLVDCRRQQHRLDDVFDGRDALPRARTLQPRLLWQLLLQRAPHHSLLQRQHARHLRYRHGFDPPAVSTGAAAAACARACLVEWQTALSCGLAAARRHARDTRKGLTASGRTPVSGCRARLQRARWRAAFQASGPHLRPQAARSPWLRCRCYSAVAAASVAPRDPLVHARARLLGHQGTGGTLAHQCHPRMRAREAQLHHC